MDCAEAHKDGRWNIPADDPAYPASTDEHVGPGRAVGTGQRGVTGDRRGSSPRDAGTVAVPVCQAGGS
jgi:hypothetical protein